MPKQLGLVLLKKEINTYPVIVINKQEQSKQEQSKQEQPKQEQPKQEQPKQEQPKQEQPNQWQNKLKIQKRIRFNLRSIMNAPKTGCKSCGS